jgi:hypothetical protein
MDSELYDDKGVLAAAYDPMYYLYTRSKRHPARLSQAANNFYLSALPQE